MRAAGLHQRRTESYLLMQTITSYFLWLSILLHSFALVPPEDAVSGRVVQPAGAVITAPQSSRVLVVCEYISWWGEINFSLPRIVWVFVFFIPWDLRPTMKRDVIMASLVPLLSAQSLRWFWFTRRRRPRSPACRPACTATPTASPTPNCSGWRTAWICSSAPPLNSPS